MPNNRAVGGRRPLFQSSGATPTSYTANSRFSIAHGCVDIAGNPRTPDNYSAVVGVTDPRETQTITITGTPTGGTFTLTFGGQTTAAIAYNASAATVETALEALSSIGSGNVSCTGGALPGTAVICDFTGGDLAGSIPALMTSTDSLTGGVTPASAITEDTTYTWKQLAVVGVDNTNLYLIAEGDIAKIITQVA